MPLSDSIVRCYKWSFILLRGQSPSFLSLLDIFGKKLGVAVPRYGVGCSKGAQNELITLVKFIYGNGIILAFVSLEALV